MRRALRVLLALAGVLLAAGGAAGLYAWRAATAPGPHGAERVVLVPRGAGTPAVAEALARAGVVADGRLFAAAALLTRHEGALRAGEFLVPARASPREVLTLLRTGRPVQRRLTVPEGLTARQIAALLAGADGLAGEVPDLAEGGFLPDTYLYERGDARAAVARRAARAMEAALAEAWAARAPDLPLASPREALILASVVERETGEAEERARVAGVFANRLRRGMPLQSDPTVTYAATDGAATDRPPTRPELDRDHPFNTYRNRGLPPGPIGAPGRAALAAATRPERHDYLYFVADGAGGHAFARTLEEHNRNVARWRALRAAPAAQAPAPAATPPR